MEIDKETKKSVQARLNILLKGIVNVKISVTDYKTLLEKTPEDSEVNIGIRRMYADLMEEEKQHVERFRELISQWEKKLKELDS